MRQLRTSEMEADMPPTMGVRMNLCNSPDMNSGKTSEKADAVDMDKNRVKGSNFLRLRINFR